MFKWLHKQGMLNAFLLLPEFLRQSEPEWLDFVSADLEKFNKYCPFRVLNCLLLAAYQSLAHHNPTLSKETLIQTLSAVFIRKINKMREEEEFVKARIERGLSVLIENFTQWREYQCGKKSPKSVFF